MSTEEYEITPEEEVQNSERNKRRSVYDDTSSRMSRPLTLINYRSARCAAACFDEKIKARIEEKRLKNTSVVFDVKPWDDDEANTLEMERQVRAIENEGMSWGASKFVDIGYGIKKLQIVCNIEEDKLEIETIREQIEELEDLVQSADVAGCNKI